jgi:hypothetical protein
VLRREDGRNNRGTCREGGRQKEGEREEVVCKNKKGKKMTKIERERDGGGGGEYEMR